MARRKRRSVGAISRKVNVTADLVQFGEGAVGFGLSNVVTARILQAVGQTTTSATTIGGVKILLAFLTSMAGKKFMRKNAKDFNAIAAGMGLSGALDILKNILPENIKTPLGLNGVNGIGALPFNAFTQGIPGSAGSSTVVRRQRQRSRD